MFDIGFFEICLIGTISLLVIGPEKLPRVARTVGLWVGKARGMVRTVKYEIDEQVRAEELKQSLETANNVLKKTVSDAPDSVETTIEETSDDIKQTIDKESS